MIECKGCRWYELQSGDIGFCYYNPQRVTKYADEYCHFHEVKSNG